MTSFDENTRDFLRQTFRRYECFQGYQTVDLEALIDSIHYKVFNTYDFVFHMNTIDLTTIAYIILNGRFCSIDKYRNSYQYSRGDLFMNDYFIHNNPHYFTLQAIDDHGMILFLSFDDYKRIATDFYHRKTSSIYETLYKSPLFDSFSISTLRKLEGICEVQCYEDGEIIIHRGDPSNFVYIILNGEISEYYNYEDFQSPWKILGSSSSFGEEGILTGFYSSTVIANGRGKYGGLPKNTSKGLIYAVKFIDKIQTKVLKINMSTLAIVVNEEMMKLMNFVHEKINYESKLMNYPLYQCHTPVYNSNDMVMMNSSANFASKLTQSSDENGCF